jgi:hypothetical protein
MNKDSSNGVYYLSVPESCSWIIELVDGYYDVIFFRYHNTSAWQRVSSSLNLPLLSSDFVRANSHIIGTPLDIDRFIEDNFEYIL